MATQTPQPSSQTFDSLPKDVIHSIADFSDKSSLIYLARTCRALSHLTEHPGLYTSLSLSLPEGSGQGGVLPSRFPSEKIYQLWRQKHALAVAARTSSALADKISKIIDRGDMGRWARVRAVDIDPRPGTLHGILQILTLSASSLVELKVVERTPCYTSSTLEEIGVGLLESSIHFPSLTSIHLGRTSRLPASALAHLCNSAPNLALVNVSFDCQKSGASGGVTTATSPPFLTETRIRKARVELTSCSDLYDPNETIHAVRNFLSFSPELQQLSLPHDGLTFDCVLSVMEGLRDHPGIEDLHWPVDIDLYRFVGVNLDDAPLHFPKLRRVILACTEKANWTQLFDDLCELPSLQQLYIDASTLEASSSTPRSSSEVQEMPPIFAAYLLKHPLLRKIHTILEPIDHGDLCVFERIDQLKSRDSEPGRVSSVVHKGVQLLHARIGMHLVETHDESADEEDSPSCHTPHLWYEGRKGGMRMKHYREQPSAVYQDYTYFKGMAVPLEILRKMRKAAGISKKDWRRRGVEVCDEAWAVLLKWHRREVKAVREAEEEQARYDAEEGCSDEDCYGENCPHRMSYHDKYERVRVARGNPRGQKDTGKHWDQESGTWIWGVGISGSGRY